MVPLSPKKSQNPTTGPTDPNVPYKSPNNWWCASYMSSIVVPEPRQSASLPHLRRRHTVQPRRRKSSEDNHRRGSTTGGTMLYAPGKPLSRIVTVIGSLETDMRVPKGLPPSPSSSINGRASVVEVLEEDLGFGSFRRRKSSFDFGDKDRPAETSQPRSTPPDRGTHLKDTFTFAPATQQAPQSKTPRMLIPPLRSFRMRLTGVR